MPLTDGNLSRHLQALNDGGLVDVWKGYKNKRPQTLCRLTDEGRRRFLEYISVLEAIVTDALGAQLRARDWRGCPRRNGSFWVHILCIEK